MLGGREAHMPLQGQSSSTDSAQLAGARRLGSAAGAIVIGVLACMAAFALPDKSISWKFCVLKTHLRLTYVVGSAVGGVCTVDCQPRCYIPRCGNRGSCECRQWRHITVCDVHSAFAEVQHLS